MCTGLLMSTWSLQSEVSAKYVIMLYNFHMFLSVLSCSLSLSLWLSLFLSDSPSFSLFLDRYHWRYSVSQFFIIIVSFHVILCHHIVLWNRQQKWQTLLCILRFTHTWQGCIPIEIHIVQQRQLFSESEKTLKTWSRRLNDTVVSSSHLKRL